jgi:dGTP triphosphohydrolase
MTSVERHQDFLLIKETAAEAMAALTVHPLQRPKMKLAFAEAIDRIHARWDSLEKLAAEAGRERDAAVAESDRLRGFVAGLGDIHKRQLEAFEARSLAVCEELRAEVEAERLRAHDSRRQIVDEVDGAVASVRNEFDSQVATVRSEFDCHVASVRSECDSQVASVRESAEAQIRRLSDEMAGRIRSHEAVAETQSRRRETLQVLLDNLMGAMEAGFETPKAVGLDAAADELRRHRIQMEQFRLSKRENHGDAAFDPNGEFPSPAVAAYAPRRARPPVEDLLLDKSPLDP